MQNLRNKIVSVDFGYFYGSKNYKINCYISSLGGRSGDAISKCFGKIQRRSKRSCKTQERSFYLIVYITGR